MILLIDNYDSFTYNLYQQIGEYYSDIVVVRNDRITVDEVAAMNPNAIILSPGPGRPEEAGICMELIEKLHSSIPILGICLGHQSIGAAFGGNIISAKEIMHGKMSSVSHSGASVFAGLPQEVEVMRYHSLAVDNTSLPDCLSIEASTSDGEIMAISHKEYPVIGIQFHPESIGTNDGSRMIKNFLQLAKCRVEVMS
ncbi:anthranilate synthase component II [Bacillus massiliigorillae]|uniref:anthranilate synthase component II n=1 Tax=Bacillus massiliigorillae TaxID=1243664 RepID=UPI0005AA1B4E|nr:aminodeoxychorismate/anthranilate synthase component II [Bacillus massiliigorillae]